MAELTEAKRPVTLADIAAHCEVDRSTVSLALRGQGRISAATAARIRQAAAELGYDPAHHATAHRMVMQRLGKAPLNQVIGLLYPADYLETNFYTTILRGITGVLNVAQVGLLIFAPEAGKQEPVAPPSFRRGDLDGLLVLGKPSWAPRLLADLRQNPRFATRPMVMLFDEEPGCVSVQADSEGGAYAATRHLLELGHRHLLKEIYPCLPGQPDHPQAQVAGVVRALQDAGLDPAAHLHLVEIDYTWVQATGLAQYQHQLYLPRQAGQPIHPVLATLQQHPQITAVLAINDASAIRTWALLQQAGIRVPDDISLVGFDDTDPVLDAQGRSLLTSVHLPLRELGQAAAELMLHLVHNEPTAGRRLGGPPHTL
jgi:LacI family transcriptional regulator